MQDLVKIEEVSRSFGDILAVNNISLSVKKGEVLGFLGPNGAGKSTTMRMITGYISPTSGKISVCDRDICEDRINAQKHIGYLPEGGPLYEDMTPASFLSFVADVRKLDNQLKKARIEYVVENLHLSKVWYQNIDTLSKGYKRRVALAQAILHDPDVLILDEPTDGLDPNQKYEVQNLISSMSANKSIIISTHILDEVEALCSRAIIIDNGKIVASGTPKQLVGKSKNLTESFRKITSKKVA
ncbi:ABC transporter ATP-binding protein [Rickettsiales bacterium]|nr:ABC transporter ATP-binding protein [Rickettsiales bacterium]